MKTVANTVYNLLLASYLLTNILADFLSIIYLLTLVLKQRDFSYTNTVCAALKDIQNRIKSNKN